MRLDEVDGNLAVLVLDRDRQPGVLERDLMGRSGHAPPPRRIGQAQLVDGQRGPRVGVGGQPGAGQSRAGGDHRASTSRDGRQRQIAEEGDRGDRGDHGVATLAPGGHCER